MEKAGKHSRGNRPMSGGGPSGFQKIKTESFRSRINKMNQNYSMVDKQLIYSSSPDKLGG
jgi:hypothetical protein